MAIVASKVLFIYNEHLATEGLLGEAFTDHGFDVDAFEVVPAERIDSPAGDVTFPDPTGYDVIVPLGARWPVYDEALRRTWVGSEMQLISDAADAGVALLGVCFGGQLLAQALGWVRCKVVQLRRSAGTTSPATIPDWYPADRGSSGTSTGGRCRPGRPRSPGQPTRRRRSCWAGRWRCSSIRRSTVRCWISGSPRTVTARSWALA